MAIITISHEIGSGGPEIGKALAERLGYRCVGPELIQDAARRYGLLEEKLSHLDEAKPSLFERFDAETRRYITVIQTALYEFAEHDNAILLGRGGQWLLRGVPHVLRVRVMAPFDVRVKRVSRKFASQAAEQTTPRTVTELVRRDDAEKLGRMRYLYEVDIRDPQLYDLVINADKVPVDASVEVIAHLARRPEMATTEAGAQLVADRSLASRVQVALASHPETRKYRITVDAKAGVVSLEGTAALDEALEVARGVDGVRQVKTQQVEIPPIPPFVA
ncbi:MAG: cytidylate kinase family protein [Candidatus Rokubacteria bacterium]|nr:cytidylate kinase family protein [Candidatus Rokubacteria bacterium]